MIDNLSTFAALNESILEAQELLTSFASQNQLLENFTTAFGSDWSLEEKSFHKTISL